MAEDVLGGAAWSFSLKASIIFGGKVWPFSQISINFLIFSCNASMSKYEFVRGNASESRKSRRKGTVQHGMGPTRFPSCLRISRHGRSPVQVLSLPFGRPGPIGLYRSSRQASTRSLCVRRQQMCHPGQSRLRPVPGILPDPTTCGLQSLRRRARLACELAGPS